MLQVDSIEKVAVDTLSSLTTLRTDTTAVTDSLRTAMADSLQAAQSGATDTFSVHLNMAEWPVTVWGDTLINPEPLYNALHTHGQPLAYSPLNDNWVTGLLLASFLLLACILAWSRQFMTEQARTFFIPTNNTQNNKKEVKTPAEVYTPFLMAFLLCVYNGLLTFALISNHFEVQAGIYPTIVILVTCLGVFAAYYLLRWLLYTFINWIFFQRTKRNEWNEGFAFLITLESIIFFPIICFSLNNPWGFKTTLLVVLSAYGLLRFLLLCLSFRTFFSKLYGLLHLFAYLCTLELIPLFALWKVFMVLSNYLIEKY